MAVSSRARTTQEANQLGGAVILPLIFLAAGYASLLLLAPPLGVIGVGVVHLGHRLGPAGPQRATLHPGPAGHRQLTAAAPTAQLAVREPRASG